MSNAAAANFGEAAGEFCWASGSSRSNQREEHWVIADLVGKGGHVRTVPVLTWVKAPIDTLTMAAGITHGAVFRAINKPGRIWGNGMTPGGVVPPYCLC